MVDVHSTPQTSQAGILARLLKARQDEMSQSAAEFLLSLEFDQCDIDRMNVLSELAREGKLSPAEESELDNYIRIGTLLGLMQSKARLRLKKLAGAH